MLRMSTHYLQESLGTRLLVSLLIINHSEQISSGESLETRAMVAHVPVPSQRARHFKFNFPARLSFIPPGRGGYRKEGIYSCITLAL